MKILIIDDNKEVSSLYKKILEDNNYSVDISNSWEESKKIIGNYNIILMDIVLPGLDGVSSLYELKKEYPDISVLIITGYPDSKNISFSIKYGADDYLIKPIEINDLLESIKRSHEKIKKKKEEEKIRKEKEKQYEQERLAILGQITAIVAHELRNPLGTIRNAINTMINENNCINEDFEKSSKRAIRNIHRCDKIIEELLMYTQRNNFNFEKRDIGKFVNNFLDELELPKNIKLERDIQLGIEVYFDYVRIESAIMNIIQNAIDAISINKSTGDIKISIWDHDKYIFISISNNGSNIPHDISNKIFDPLFTTKSFGVGLGLPNADKIMKEHDGGIMLNNGKNFVDFIMYFPIKEEINESFSH